MYQNGGRAFCRFGAYLSVMRIFLCNFVQNYPFVLRYNWYGIGIL